MPTRKFGIVPLGQAVLVVSLVLLILWSVGGYDNTAACPSTLTCELYLRVESADHDNGTSTQLLGESWSTRSRPSFVFVSTLRSAPSGKEGALSEPAPMESNIPSRSISEHHLFFGRADISSP